MHYHSLSFILRLFKFFKIVDDSSSRYDRFSVSCFPQKSAVLFKMATISSSRGSAAASEIRVIQNDNNDQDNIEKISSEESVNSQEGKEGNAARWSNTE